MLRCRGLEAVLRILGGLAVLLATLFLAVQPFNRASAGEPPPVPDLAFPFADGKPWRITCGYSGDEGCGHPDNQWNRFAIDMQHGDGPVATEGEPIGAAAAGTVTIAEWGGANSFGWYVQIDHGDGYQTVYAHFESAPLVTLRQEVEQGDVLGLAGCTGRCTGPHVHFVLLLDGHSIPPEPICGQTDIAAGQFHSSCAEQASQGFVAAPPGDATCDGNTDSIDAAVVLQFNAGLFQSLLCAHAADVNWDAAPDAIDAALILQFNAGLLESLARGVWNVATPMPAARGEVTSAVLDGVIYVIGGIDAEAVGSDRVAIYDTKEDTWSNVASLPAPLDHATAAAVDGKIYAIGGYSSFAERAISSAVYEYDPLTNRWTARGEMPLPRAAAAAVTIDGIVYVLGGVGPRPEVPLAYNPATDEWLELAPMDAPREHVAAVALDGLVYVAGGRENVTENVDAFAAYDPLADAWDTLEPMPTARSGLAGVVLDGRIHVLGGEDVGTERVTFAQHEVYTPDLKAWRLAPSLPAPRHGLTAQVVDGALYAIAGGPEPGLSVSDAVDIYETGASFAPQPASIPLIRRP